MEVFVRTTQPFSVLRLISARFLILIWLSVCLCCFILATKCGSILIGCETNPPRKINQSPILLTYSLFPIPLFKPAPSPPTLPLCASLVNGDNKLNVFAIFTAPFSICCAFKPPFNLSPPLSFEQILPCFLSNHPTNQRTIMSVSLLAFLSFLVS